MSTVREQIEFLEIIEATAAERSAAYEVRHTDPERWRTAKQAYADLRSFWRSVRMNADATTVTPDTVAGSADTNAPGED